MTTISRLALVYETVGEKEEQKADEDVQKQVNKTGKAAKKQTGVTKRWMTANKTAMLAVGAAAAGAMALIIKHSPSMGAAMDEARFAFSLMAFEVGESLAPVLEPLSDKLLELAIKFGELPGPVKGVIGVLTLALVAFGLLTGAIVTYNVVAGIWAGTTIAATLAQWQLNAAMYANPIGLVVLAIIAIIAILYILEKEFGVVTKAVKWLTEKFMLLWNWIKRIGAIMKTGFTAALDIVKNALNKIKDVFVKVWETIKVFIAGILLTIKAILTGDTKLLKKIWEKMGEKLKEIWGDTWDKIVAFLKKVVKKIWDGMKYIFNPANWAKIGSKLWDAGSDLIKSLIKGMGNVGDKIWKGIKDGLHDTAGKINKWAEGVLGLSPTLLEIAAKVPKTIAKGIGSNASVMTTAMTGMAHVGSMGFGASPIATGAPASVATAQATGGGSITLNIESGAFVFEGESGEGFDEQRVVNLMSEALQQLLGSRGI